MFKAAFRYFALIFGLGFLLGTLRVTILVPMTGETAAVLLEVPVMVAASALLARQTIRLYGLTVPGRAFGVGALAFVMLMAAEAVLAHFVNGQNLTQWIVSLSETPGWIGLAGQIAFGLFPLFWSFLPKQLQHTGGGRKQPG